MAEELGPALAARLPEHPAAAASLGQVYRMPRASGPDMALKVRRGKARNARATVLTYFSDFAARASQSILLCIHNQPEPRVTCHLMIPTGHPCAVERGSHTATPRGRSSDLDYGKRSQWTSPPALRRAQEQGWISGPGGRPR